MTPAEKKNIAPEDKKRKEKEHSESKYLFESTMKSSKRRLEHCRLVREN